MPKVEKHIWFIIVSVYRYGTEPGIPNIMYSLYRKTSSPAYDTFGASSMEDALGDVTGCEGMELLYHTDEIETGMLTSIQAERLGMKMVRVRVNEMFKINR